MKIMIFLAAVFLSVLGCNKDTNTENPNAPGSFNKEDYEIMAEQMPEPIGGIKAIQENIVYPEDAKDEGIEGKVFILAFINENGDVTNAEVIKSAHPSLDSAAIKAVRQVKFEPGKNEGKKVKVQVTVPIVFKLGPGK